MKKYTRFLTTLLAAALLVVAALPSAFAAGSNYSGTIEGTKTTTFDKYLVMDADANVPNATFTYAVTAGAKKSYNIQDADKTFEVLAGVDADKVTMAGVGTGAQKFEIVYKQGDDTANDANTLIKEYNNTTQKYALKTATLDFSQVNFTEPGVYRYIITESGTNQGITNDADVTRVLDVYVYDDSSETEKKLKIQDYILHSNVDDEPVVAMGSNNGSAGAYTATKSQGFTNVYDTSDLTFRKEVSGNQASRDKYFEFTVEISDAVAGTKYDVDITGADATPLSNDATTVTTAANPTSITVPDGATTVTQKFYLQHGQEITIQGLAKDTRYSVSENPEDYKSTAAGVTGYTDAVSGTIASTDLKTSYLNTRNGVIPTGVLLTVAPFAAIMAIGAVGILVMVGKKRKRAE